MKTALTAITAATLIAASTAHSAGIEIGAVYEDQVQASDTAAVFVRPFAQVADYQVGVRLLARRDVKTGDMLTFVEPQVTRMFPVGTSGVSLGGTVGVGLLTVKSDSYWYGSVEPKATLAVNDKLTFGVGVRYRDSFNEQLNFETLTYSASANYKVSKATSITFTGFEKNLDERSTGVLLSVTQGF
jgi:hypothetical protein